MREGGFSQLLSGLDAKLGGGKWCRLISGGVEIVLISVIQVCTTQALPFVVRFDKKPGDLPQNDTLQATGCDPLPVLALAARALPAEGLDLGLRSGCRTLLSSRRLGGPNIFQRVVPGRTKPRTRPPGLGLQLGQIPHFPGTCPKCAQAGAAKMCFEYTLVHKNATGAAKLERQAGATKHAAVLACFHCKVYLYGLSWKKDRCIQVGESM